MGISALQAHQLAAATAALTKNFGPAGTPQNAFADMMYSSAQGGIQAENAKKLAKKMNKKGPFDIVKDVVGIGSDVMSIANPFMGGGSSVPAATTGYVGNGYGYGGGSPVGPSQYGYGEGNPVGAPYYAAPAAAVPQGTADPMFTEPGAVTASNLPAPQAAPAAATAGPLASGYVPAAMPQATVNAPQNLDSNVGAMLGPALLAGGAALGTRYLQNRNTPSGAETIRNAQRQDSASTADFSATGWRSAGLIDAINGMSRSELNSPKGMLQASIYVDQMKQLGQKIPTSNWFKLPRQVRRQYANNPQYQGIIPGGGEKVAYALGPVAAGLGVYGAARQMNSQLQPNPDGTVDYIPGG